MSEQVEQRLVALLGHPHTSPYGNPIPGLDQLGFNDEFTSESHVDLISAEAAANRGGKWEIRRIIEPVQNIPEVMDQLQRGGITPGKTIEFGYRADALIAIDGPITTELSRDIAKGIHVRPAS